MKFRNGWADPYPLSILFEYDSVFHSFAPRCIEIVCLDEWKRPETVWG
jgi:hypothetical protein